MYLLKYLFPLFLMVLLSCSQPQTKTPPPYYKTELVKFLDEPVEALDGKISTTNGIQFSNDGHTLYISKNLESTFTNGRNIAGIFTHTYQEGEWGPAEALIFENGIDAYHPVLSMDNQLLFFNSRSHQDTIEKSIPHDIWVSQRKNDKWTTPVLATAVNSPHYDSYPSIAANNNLYFNSDRPGGQGGMDIYFSKFQDGAYLDPVNLDILNSPDSENDLVVDPKERFIIFNRYINETREVDLFISRNVGGEWQSPKPLDNINQVGKWELTPTLSPDGQYFFYELDGKIMQVSLSVLMEDK